MSPALGRFAWKDARYDVFAWEPSGRALPPLPPLPLPGGGLRWEEVDAGNVGAYPDPAVLDELRRLLVLGHRGLHALVDGKVAHRSWWKPHPGLQRGLAGAPLLTLGPGEAFIHYCETVPAFRGRGIYPRALQKILATLASEGVRRVRIACEDGNAASLRGIERAGFVREGSVHVRARLGWVRAVRR